MEVTEALRRWGTVASRAQLLTVCARADVDRALREGTVVALARGRYALPCVSEDLAVAHRLSGVLSHESAALQHGWAVLLTPERPSVTVPVRRKVDPSRAREALLRRVDLHTDEVSGSATSQERTVLDCLRSLPFAHALAVADSALREGRSPAWLHRIAAQARGRGSVQARRVAAEASELAANPFESGLRAISLDVPGLRLRPQLSLWADDTFLGRPDLVDPELRIVVEADSFAWHGTRQALVRDATRYNGFSARGWMVLRFTWEDVVLHPDDVEMTLRMAVETRCHQPRARRKRPASPIDTVAVRGAVS